MNNKKFKSLLKQCIAEVIVESITPVSEEAQPEMYDAETDTFAPGPRDRMEPSTSSTDANKNNPEFENPPRPKLKEMAQTSIMHKLSNSERTKIGLEFKKLGLDGNGRFEKKEAGLSAVTTALGNLGFNLDMVSGDIIMGDKGSRNLTFRRKNAEGQDAFSENPEIKNSRIVFTWERMDGPTAQNPNSPSKFEVLAYAS